MLISLSEILIKYNFKPKGVIQVGCHWAEEHEQFIAASIRYKAYIEPCHDAFEIMSNKVKGDDDTICFNYACGSESALIHMNVSHNNQGQSNSILSPLLHLNQHPEVIFTDKELVKVSPLDSFPLHRDLYDLLLMDTQGYEGEILKGAINTLSYIKMIYTECNRGQTYTGNMEIEEMDNFLLLYGFIRVETYWPSPNWTWGDCVYVHKSII